jgi:hypothetical protein
LGFQPNRERPFILFSRSKAKEASQKNIELGGLIDIIENNLLKLSEKGLLALG